MKNRAESVVEQSDTSISGETILVTGATAGIGRETAIALGRLGAHVIVHGRNEQRGTEVVSRLNSTAGSGSFIAADFATQEGVIELAETVRSEHDEISTLVNNAGGWFTEGRLTGSGIEYTFAVNHLAPFRLTYELLPVIAEGGGRVVTVASEAHRQGSMDFGAIRTVDEYSGWQAYCRSKLANILFTRELSRRLKAAPSEVTANTLHPGIVPGSGFLRNALLPIRALTRIATVLPDAIVGQIVDTPTDAAETSVYLVADESGSTHTGQYFVDESPTEPSEQATDERLAKRLWNRSAELTGIDPDYGLDGQTDTTSESHLDIRNPVREFTSPDPQANGE